MCRCLFCEMIARDVPAEIVFEDEQVIVVLDHRPVRPGHCMVIPKQHVEQFTDLPVALACHIVTIANELGRVILKSFDPKPLRIDFVDHGQIPHVHYHVIPQHDEIDITSGLYARIENGEVVFDAEAVPMADSEHQKRINRLIKGAMMLSRNDP